MLSVAPALANIAGVAAAAAVVSAGFADAESLPAFSPEEHAAKTMNELLEARSAR